MAEARGVVVLVATGFAGAVAGWAGAALQGGRAEPPDSPSEIARERDALREERDALRAQVKALQVPAAPKHASTTQAPASPPTPMAVAPMARVAARETTAPAAPPPTMQAEASALCGPWVTDILQIKDAAKRAAALEAVREALASGEGARVLAALQAIRQISRIDYDKASMHLLVRPFLQSEDRATRTHAVWAFRTSGLQPGDVDALLPLADDPVPEIRLSVPGVLSQVLKGDLSGEAGKVIARVLGEISPSDARHAVNGMLLRTASPELEERLVALARAKETRSDVIYYLLSTLPEKPAWAIDVMIEALDEKEGETAGRALWGLCRGIPAAEAPRVSRAILGLLEDRATTMDWGLAFQGLRTIGTEAEIPGLERLSRNELIPESIRKAATETAEAIRRRASR